MRVRLHSDAAVALAAAAPRLRSDPFSTNVVAVASARIAGDSRLADPDYLWATIEDTDGSVVGVAMHTPPFPLFLSRMPATAAAALATELAATGRVLDGVNGACESTSAFTDAWCGLTGQRSTTRTRMRMYRLQTLTPPHGVPGGSQLAAPDDLDLLLEWLGGFHREATPDAPAQDLVTLVQRRTAAGEFHLWQHAGERVSLAGVSAPAAGVARVAPVYTRPDARRRGFGAAVAAAATAVALAAGAEQVVLYADLANPTSNSIYQAIGYQPDHDGDQRSFSARTGA